MLRPILATCAVWALLCTSADAQMLMPPTDLCAGVAGATIVPAGQMLTATTNTTIPPCLGVHGTLSIGPGVTFSQVTIHIYADGALKMTGGTIVIADTAPTDADQFTTGLVIEGRYEITGTPVRAWMRLAGPLTAGQTVLQLPDDPTGWKVGDLLLIPDTKEYPEALLAQGLWPQPETPRVCAVSGRTITLCAGLGIDHPDAWSTDRAVHVVPMVGNVSRSITIKSANATGNRGHLMITRGAMGFMRNVRIESMGRTLGGEKDTLGCPQNCKGRYADHLHMLDNGAANEQENVVVVDARKWGMTIHGTNGVRLTNPIIFSAQGAGVMTEDGSERDNLVQGLLCNSVWGHGDRFYGGGAIGLNGTCAWFQGAHNALIDSVASNGHFAFSPYGSAPDNWELGTWQRNESVGTTNCFNPWDLWGGGRLQGLTCWHQIKFGAYVGSSANLIVEDLACLFDPQYHTINGQDTAPWNRTECYTAGDYEALNAVLIRPRSEYAYGGIYPSIGCAAGDCANLTPRMTRIDDPILCGNTYGVWTSTPNTSTQLLAQRRFTVNRPRLCSGDVLAAKLYVNEGKSNLISPLELTVTAENGDATQNYAVYSWAQSAGMIVPATGSNGGENQPIGSPEVGLTNEENWSKYGVAIMGAVAPLGCVTRSSVAQGWACPTLVVQPQPSALRLSCPSSIHVTSAVPVLVPIPAAVPSGGTPPYTTPFYTPAETTLFPLGATSVQGKVSDSGSPAQSATCSLTVTVAAPEPPPPPPPPVNTCTTNPITLTVRSWPTWMSGARSRPDYTATYLATDAAGAKVEWLRSPDRAVLTVARGCSATVTK